MRIALITSLILLLHNLTLPAQIEVRVYNNPFLSSDKMDYLYYSDFYTTTTFKLLRESSNLKEIHPFNTHIALLKHFGKGWWVGLEGGHLEYSFYSEFSLDQFKQSFSFNNYTYTLQQSTQSISGLSLLIEKKFLRNNNLFINLQIGLYGSTIRTYQNTVKEVYSSIGDYRTRENFHEYSEYSRNILPRFCLQGGYLFFTGAFQPFLSAGASLFQPQYITGLSPVSIAQKRALITLELGIGIQYTFHQPNKNQAL